MGSWLGIPSIIKKVHFCALEYGPSMSPQAIFPTLQDTIPNSRAGAFPPIEVTFVVLIHKYCPQRHS